MDREKEMELFLSDVKSKLEELTGEMVVIERANKCNNMKMYGVRKATRKERESAMDGANGDVEAQEEVFSEESQGCREPEILPVVYLNTCFAQYKEGKATLEEIAERVTKAWEEAACREIDFAGILNREYVKSKVMYRLINYGYNMNLLKKAPHERFLDLAKVYYIMVEIAEGETGTLLVKNEHLEKLGITEEELKECAERNTVRLMPAYVKDIAGTLVALAERMDIPGESIEAIKKMKKGMLYVACNKCGMYGASVLCYPGFVAGLAEKIESDLVVFPSSLHEVMVCPVQNYFDMAYFKQMVFDINRTEVAWEEVLSDSVYYYVREKQELIVV